MAYDIKKLKPKQGGHYKQGYFDVSKSTKYIGTDPVIYRSSLEYRIFNMFERSPKIVRWCSEPDFIKIYYEFKGKKMQYFMDCYAEFDNGVKQLIEVKPHAQTQAPELRKYKNEASFNRDLETYQRNLAKWRASIEFARANNMEFKIITDVTINKYM